MWEPFDPALAGPAGNESRLEILDRLPADATQNGGWAQATGCRAGVGLAGSPLLALRRVLHRAGESHFESRMIVAGVVQ